MQNQARNYSSEIKAEYNIDTDGGMDYQPIVKLEVAREPHGHANKRTYRVTIADGREFLAYGDSHMMIWRDYDITDLRGTYTESEFYSAEQYMNTLAQAS